MVGYNRLFYRNQLGFKLLRVQLHRKFGANSEEIKFRQEGIIFSLCLVQGFQG